MKMRLITLAIPLALILTGHAARGADCVDRNLETLPGSSMQRIPVYDQDSSGTCYAYAASELMNAYVLDRDPTSPLKIHPAVAAIRFKRRFDPQAELSGGDVTDTIRAVRTGFNYRYDGVSEDLSKIAGDSGMSESEVLQMIESVGELMTDPAIQWGLAKSTKRKQYETAIRKRVASQIDLDLSESHSACPSQVAETIEGFIQTASIASSVKIAGETLFSIKNREFKPPYFYIPEPEQVTGIRNSFDRHAEVIRDHFANGARLPLGISFCSKIIRDPKLRAIEGEVGYMRRIPDMDNCEHHAALITGTRKNGERCEFLIRNTWGSQFANENRLSCVCQHRLTREFLECPGNGHQSGDLSAPLIPDAPDLKVISCWIAEDELSRNMTGITRLK